jgi:hypothetical protein
MSNYRRRVLALEQAARIVGRSAVIDAEIEAHRATIDAMAADLDMTPEAVEGEVRDHYRRRDEIGPDAHDRELADDMGLTVDQLRDPDFMRQYSDQLEREWSEWQERRRQEQAQVISWRGGVKYRGGVPVTD